VDLVLSELQRLTPDRLPVEIVERKGVGHPDTICDALAEKLSGALSKFYQQRFGRVLHHNVDKVLLCAGAARPAFGGGEILEPMDVYISGRVTREVGGVPVPVEELADAACRGWLRRNLHALDSDRHVRLHLLVRPGSPELVELFLRQQPGTPPLSNDAAIGVGFAPLSHLERLTLAVEERLNSPEEKSTCPALGEDVKVLSVRRRNRVDLTLACAIIGRHASSLAEYLEARRRAKNIAQDTAQRAADLDVATEVNTADDPAAGSVYLTVTGTSAEGGDDGQTGRGNRVNGLVTPYRPMSLEAAAGKNPLSHPGRLYQIAARRIAAAVVHEIEEISAVECYLVSRIGRPITDPHVVELKLQPRRGGSPDHFAGEVRPILERELALLPTYWREVSGEAELP
jgi:S-adenosylmethionine synthetase